ncbi:TniQ family protein, partial [Variovorax sp. H27-G14]|uniref:TniQ family protein n=1 Tax=Variovorax sp. H27-G14 TaxID=3111914 RepID=UPI0038FCD3DC
MAQSSPHYMHPRAGLPPAGGFPISLIRTRPIGTTGANSGYAESLASWICRLQKANQILRLKLLMARAGFVNFAFVDCPPHFELAVTAWSRLSGRSTQEIAPMLLSLRDTQMTQDKSSFVLRAWALQPRPARSLANRCRHVICPICLAQDEVAYWRKSWRFATTVCCDVHDTRMIESCPQCQSGFAIPRLGSCPLSHCDSCGLDLRLLSPKSDALAGRLIRKTIHQLYADADSTATPLEGWPCRRLRRLLAFGCSAGPEQTSLESISDLRIRAGLRNAVIVRFVDLFACRPIDIRWRAACLVEDRAGPGNLNKPISVETAPAGEDLACEDWSEYEQKTPPHALSGL